MQTENSHPPAARASASCILASEPAEKRRTGRVSSRASGPSEAAGEQDATRPNTRSRTRTVDGAASRKLLLILNAMLKTKTIWRSPCPAAG